MEVAADAFDELAAHHQRGSTRANCRILLLALFVGLVTSFVILLAVDATRTSSARRYASAVAWQHKAGMHCDAALGRRRLWFGDTVTSYELCVGHNENRSVVRRFNDATLSFLVIGDWGRDGMCCQRDVAVEMSTAAKKMRPSFIVSTGDNFYEQGIPSPDDDQVKRSWRDVYVNPHPSMHDLQWKVILGNHDHETNIDAQTQLTNRDNLWHMPNSYFFETSDDGKVFMAFLDTTVMYHTDDQLRMYFSGESVTPEYRDAQLSHLKTALAQSNSDWKLVFGHHPLFASSEHGLLEPYNIKRMQTMLMPILKENRVAAYFSGHEHTLEHHESNGVHFFLSGAGSKIRGLELNLNEARFALAKQGFMAVSLRTAAEVLNVQVVDMEGHVVHVAEVKKP